MKCIQNIDTDAVIRVSDEDARRLTKGGWRYVAKHVWRATQPLRPSQGGKKEPK
jgi:hypothetical protein